jgi:beta-fructofuranosidase
MRPALHFTPASGWINDPHGITARDGKYDVFFQYVPNRTVWAPDCHWGHATGSDLLTLTEQSVAIAPGDGDDGIWTGCIVEDGDNTKAFYTATSIPDFGIGRVRVAHPADEEWDSWEKGDVVVRAPADLDLVAFRDPFIRRDGDIWRMFVGAAGSDGTAMALTYASPDLAAWEYEGVALQRHTSEREPIWAGALWECPQVFDLGGGAVMVSSIWDADVLHYAAYALGSFTDGQFTARQWGRLTWGDSLYAPSLFTDAEGELALSFWLRGITGDGWAGAHSVPYRLRVSGERLVASPHPDVAAHRSAVSLDGTVPSLAADIEWESSGGTLRVMSRGAVTATLHVADGEATVTTPSSTSTFPVDHAMRIILDGPVLEISSDAGIFAAAIQPAGSGLHIAASSGSLRVHGLA